MLTSSQVYIGPKVALEIYRTSPSFEYGSLDALRLTNGLLAAYGALKDAPDLSPATAKDRAHKAILMLMERGITLADIHCLPISVASPLLEALRTAQNSPPSDWPPDAYLLVGRNDLAKMALGDIEESLSFGEYFVPKSANLVSSRLLFLVVFQVTNLKNKSASNKHMRRSMLSVSTHGCSHPCVLVPPWKRIQVGKTSQP